MSTWNLDLLYTGYDSETFKKDLESLPKAIESLNQFVERNQKLSVETCHELILLLQDYTLLVRKLGGYTFLRSSTNTTDKETVAFKTKIGNILTSASKARAVIQKLFAAVDLETFAKEDELIANHRFMIEETKKNAKYLLSDEVEEAISKMQLNGSNSWANLHQYLTSTLEVEYNGGKTTLSEIRNLAYSSDANVRKAAYFAELEAYSKIKDGMAFSLNSIKGEANTVAEMRGYESVLDMTLVDSRLSKKTLDAMLSAMKQYLPKFQKYLRHKASLLGHTNGLPFYDMFAVLESAEGSNFTIEEAKDYLVKNFASFSDSLSNIVTKAYEQEWIDFYPKQGKVGGAFCSNLPFLKQSRILLNYDNSLSDVVTLAHELGHAYHGECIQGHSVLNMSYTMPVAETASTFNETIIMNAAIQDAKNDQEKAMLIESMLQDVTQVICDIYSRFLFESEVVERRKNEFLFSDELNEIMRKAQLEAYGDGLDENLLHPYMWACKGHYYRSNLNFYNFPYAFGCLFAKGLYAQFKKQGESFVAKYDELLHATVVSSCEEVASMADIDLTKEEFWLDSLEMMSEYIDQFISLTTNGK